MTEFLEFAKTYGLPMALVVVFIYWSYRRENKLGDKLNEVETYVRATLGNALNESTKALTESTKAINRSTDVMAQVLDELKFRDRKDK